MRLHFRERGDGPPLIILHGLFGSLENWGHISQQLADSFRVISVDQRNHGQSPHDSTMNYSALTDDLREFMDDLNLTSAHLLGHSMGGKTAMQFALTFPKRVNRLVVVDMAPRGYAPKHELIFAALLALDLKRYETRAQVEEALTPKIPELGVRRFLLKGLAKNAEGAFTWRFNLPTLREHYDKLTATLEVQGTFEKPALFLRGGESDYICEEDQAMIRKLFPNARIATIPGASHWLHAEAPEPFLEVTRKFLSEKVG